MILWGRPSSVNVQKVLWALEEYGLSYDHKIVGGRYGGVDDPDFAQLTPTRKVPVLQDGAVAVWESNAILRYLGRKHPDHGVSQRLDHADAWMDFGTASFQPPFIALFWQLVRMRPEARSEVAISAAREKLSAAIEIIEDGLSQGRDGLGHADLSLADIAVGAPFYRIQTLAPDLVEDLPCITEWLGRLSARTGWTTHIATSFDELRPSQ